MDTSQCGVRARAGIAVVASLACVLVAGCSREPATPEAKRERGDEIVKRMSDHLAQAKSFTVETTDSRTRSRGGKEIAVRTTRQLTLRRPDRLALRVSGDMDLRGWYDGSQLTFVSDPQKVWARAKGAANIDETLDRMADRLAMPLPMADFLYSSPYDALIGTESTGGYVGTETVGGVACHHLAYKHPSVDWELWVPESGDPLPKKFVVTSKASKSGRKTEVMFDKWTVGAEAADAAFTPEVPAGYERIQIVVGATETAASAATPAAAESGAPKQ